MVRINNTVKLSMIIYDIVHIYTTLNRAKCKNRKICSKNRVALRIFLFEVLFGCLA